MKQNDLSLSQIQAVIDGLDHYFPQDNSQNVYVNDTWEDFNKMYKWRGRDDYFTTLSEITGVEKITDIKVATQKLYELRETLTKTPEYNEVNLTQTPEYTETTTTNSVTPDEGTREVQAEELEYRETETEKSRQVAKQKELKFEDRIRSIKSRIFLKPKNDPNEIQLTKTQKEFIHNLALASTKDAGTTQEYIEGLIKSSIPEDKIDDYPDALIKNRSANFVQGLRNFSSYKSPDEIPDVLVVTPPYSPLTSLINPNSQGMVNTFTDNFLRNQIADDAQKTILTLSTQRDVDAEIFEPAVFGGDKNLTYVFFGGDKIEEYEISDTQQDSSIEITVSDLESLHKNSQEIESFISKYLQIENQNIPVVSTGFVPLRIPESELKSVDKTILKTKSTIGGIEGEETQGALARKILREKAKLINQVVTIAPSTNPEIVNETKNILSKISGEVVPKTIVKNLAPKSINLSVYIGEGVKPVTIAVTGEFGGSTESFLTLLEKNGTPLFFTSLDIGEYAKNQAVFSQAIASKFNGELLMHIGAGKYSFEIVNAGNTILGGVPLSRYVATLQLGGRSLGLEVTKKAGKIISSTLIKTAGGVTTRTVLPSFITKIIAAVGGATGPVGLAISATIGWLIGKVIQLIGKIIPPEKFKKFLTNTKEIIFGTGLVGLYLGVTTGSVLAMGLGTIGTIAGAGTAFATGGFSTTGLVTGVNGITSALGTAFSFALAGIAGPILFILLGFPVIVALILFIINSGAYVVPPKSPDSPFLNSGGGFPIVCSDEKGPVGVDGPFSSSPIANRAWEITYDLYQGFWCYWNRSPIAPKQYFPNDTLKYSPGYPNLFDYELFRSNPNPPANLAGNALYWCTWLVVHSYDGKTQTSLWVPNMYNDFNNRNKILDSSLATTGNLPSGSVVFFHVTTGEVRLNHVGIVYSVDKGGIDIVQSNAPTKYFRAPFNPGGIGIPGVGTMQIEYFGLP